MAIWKRMSRIEDEAADSGWEDDNSSRDWEAGLPEGILGMISDRLSVSDCLSFIDVCCSWSNVVIEKQLELNSKAQPPSMLRGFPLLLGPGQRYRRTRIGLSDKFSSWEIDMPEAYMKYYWGSFHDWLILVKDLRPLNRIGIQLYNPFYGLTIDLPTSLNVHPKIVVSGLPCEKNFACILLPSAFPIPYFWVPGLKEWHDCCRLSRSVHVVDAVSCNGYFYLLTDDFNLVTIDLSDVFPMDVGGGDHNNFVVRTQLHEVQMSERPKKAGGLGLLRYLVESQGEILLVCRFFDTKVGHTYDTTQFAIYKLDHASHQMAWSELHSLGDRILFLGRSSSRSFSAQDLGVQEANCIYFANEQPIVNYNEWDVTPFRNKLSCFAMEGLVENSDWGRYDFNGVGNFTFHGNRDHFFPVWITAPLSMCCGGMKRCVKF